MYVRVLQDELQFPEDRAMDQDTKSLIRGVSSTLRDSCAWQGPDWFDFLSLAVATQPRAEDERA